MPNIFDNGNDDFMFPTTPMGLRAVGIVFENAKSNEAGASGNGMVLENAVDNDAVARVRASAMSAVLSWVEDGEFDYNALDETIAVVADIDGDFELTEAEEELYGDIWNEIPDALLTLGADIEDVKAIVDGPGKDADSAAARVGNALTDEMDETQADDDSLIAGFAYGEDAILESCSYDDALHGVLEASFKRKKVVRDGKVKVIRKRVSGKVRLSAAQKAGLKKARRKANTATAKLKRKKSMKIRKNRGL